MRSERLWQTARLVEDADGRRWLEFPDVSRCRRCREGRGCGAAQWSRLFGVRSALRLPMPDTEYRFSPGAEVRAGLTAGALIGAAIRAYLLPLLTFVVLLIVADRLGAPEPIALVLGLVAALLMLRALRGGALRNLEPRIEPIERSIGPAADPTTGPAIDSAVDSSCGALESEPDRVHLYGHERSAEGRAASACRAARTLGGDGPPAAGGTQTKTPNPSNRNEDDSK